MDTLLDYRGYAVANTHPRLAAALEQLTVRPNAAPGIRTKPPPLTFYRSGSRYTFVPRSFGYDVFGEPLRQNLRYIPRAFPSESWRFTGDLLPHQAEARQAYIGAAASSAPRHGILRVPCGWGKTVCALSIASELKLRTLVVVDEEDLGAQWVERIERFLPGAKTGWIQGDKYPEPDCNIAIGMLQTLSKRDGLATQLAADWGFIIVDECHVIGSEVYTRCLQNVCPPCIIGLSATPRRSDGLTDVIHWFLGPVVYASDPLPDPGVIVRRVDFMCDALPYAEIPISPHTGMVASAEQMNNVGACEQRNELILRLLAERCAESPEAQVLVLSARREGQIEWLEREWKARYPQYASGAILGRQGKNKAKHRASVKTSESARVIWGTYQKAKKGIDIASLNTLLFATPIKDIEQACGRIIRKPRELRTLAPLIIDIVDVRHPNLKRQAAERKRYYKLRGYSYGAADSGPDLSDSD